eukprot:3936499-Rhodomonas_salina.1
MLRRQFPTIAPCVALSPHERSADARAHAPSAGQRAPAGHVRQAGPLVDATRYVWRAHTHSSGDAEPRPAVVEKDGHSRHDESEVAPASRP